MPLPTLPASGSTSWYAHYSAMHSAIQGGDGIIVAANDAPQTWKDRADYQCDNVADDVQINAAINAAQPLQGTVILSPTVAGFGCTAPVNIVGRVRVVGGGGWGRTQIRAQAGHSAIDNDDSGVVVFTDPALQPYDMGGLHHVNINGNGLDLNGFASVLTQTGAEKDDNNLAGSPDTQFHIDYVMVHSCDRRGIYVGFGAGSASTSWHIDHCFIFGCGDGGSYAGIDVGGTDCWISNCNVGSQGNEGTGIPVGFRCAGSDNNWVNNTAWVTKGDGFLITGAKQALTNCQAHHSIQDGFSIQNNRNVLTGCISYNNARDNFRINANDVVIEGCHGFDDGDSFAVTGRPSDTGFNFVQVTGRGHRVTGVTFGNGVASYTHGGCLDDAGNASDVSISHLGNDVNGSTGTRQHHHWENGLLEYSGTGAPALAPPNGSRYWRTDGGAGSTFYVREAGAWVGK